MVVIGMLHQCFAWLNSIIGLSSYVFSVWLDCFVILPFCFAYDKVQADLKNIAQGQESTWLRSLARLALAYFQSAERVPRGGRRRSDRKEMPPYLNLRPADSAVDAQELDFDSAASSPSPSRRTPSEDKVWNALLEQLWPQLSQFLRLRLMRVLDKILCTYAASSSVIKSAKITSLDLGDVCPKVLQVTVNSLMSSPAGGASRLDSGSVHAVVRFEWVNSNCEGGVNIVESSPFGLSGHLKIKNVSGSGSVHVVLGPLMAAMPPFACCTLFFMRKPRISLSLEGHFGLDADREGGLSLGKTLSSNLGKVLRDHLRSLFVFPKTLVISVVSPSTPHATSTL